jgi:protein-disulfide isomerase
MVNPLYLKRPVQGEFMKKRLTILSCAALIGLAAAPSFAADPAPAFTAEQRTALEAIVKDVMRNNPEIIVESVRAMQMKQQAMAQQAQQQALKERGKDLFKDENLPTAGNPKGDVSVAEFYDYQCGYCKKAHPTIQQLIQDDKNVKVIYVQYPILGPASLTASKAALAAHKQGKFAAMHEALMANQGPLNDEKIFDLASKAGLNVDKLKTDMASPAIEEEIKKTLALGQSLNVQGTPGFVIGEALIPGAVDLAEMKAKVADARKKK